MADDDKIKEALKEALKEWLDEKYATFGRYSLGALGASVLTVLIYFVLTSQGWHK